MNEKHWQRLYSHIYNIFDEYLKKYPLKNYKEHNALLDVRNLIVNSVENLLNESAIRKKYGVSVDSLSLISFSKEEAINPRNSWIPIPSENNETRPAGITNEEFKGYSESLQKVFTNAGLYNSSLYLDVLSLFRDAFLKPSENRPFKSGTYVRLEFGVTTSESIKKQNIPCEICAENRVTDICHIIPKRLRGAHDIDNVLYLCPTHHRLFDNCMLSKDEWGKIDWCSKNEKSQIYAFKVLKVEQEKFWEKVDLGLFKKQTTWEIDIYKNYNDHKNEIQNKD